MLDQGVTPVTAGMACPECGSTIVSEYGYAPWCPRCEWNLERYEPDDGTSPLGQRIGAWLYRKAYRATMAQYRRRLDHVGRPSRFSVGSMVLMATALAMYAAVLALLGVGIWLITLGTGPAIGLGVFVVVLALYLFPRLGGLDSADDQITRAEAPTLFALIDEVHKVGGVKSPHVVVVDPWLNAAAGAFGFRRRRVLVLGLALWGSISPQQRVALLGHELGHFSNGDVRRLTFVQPALATLVRLADLLRPSWSDSALSSLQAIVAAPLRMLLRATYILLMLVSLRNGHEAEYEADRVGAQLGGSAAAVELADMLLAPAIAVITSRARAGELAPGWRAAVTEMMESRRPRRANLRQLSVRHQVSAWSSHPPGGLRVRLVEGGPQYAPRVVLSQADSDRIDEELAKYYVRFRTDLAQSNL